MKKFSVFLCVILIICGGIDFAHATPYRYSFSVNGGASTIINPYSGMESALEYYNFYSDSGHPSFGPKEDMAFFWLWHETDTDDVSLNVIFSKEDNNTEGSGKAYFTISGLPASWFWCLRDDVGDISDIHDNTPTWNWNDKNTDGGIISGLEDLEWDIIWKVNELCGIDSWYFLSAGEGKYDHEFCLKKCGNLKISSELVCCEPVPEPTTMLLLGSGLIGLAGFRCKKLN